MLVNNINTAHIALDWNKYYSKKNNIGGENTTNLTESLKMLQFNFDFILFKNANLTISLKVLQFNFEFTRFKQVRKKLLRSLCFRF